jgi:hypothetical protein
MPIIYHTMMCAIFHAEPRSNAGIAGLLPWAQSKHQASQTWRRLTLVCSSVKLPPAEGLIRARKVSPHDRHAAANSKNSLHGQAI